VKGYNLDQKRGQRAVTDAAVIQAMVYRRFVPGIASRRRWL